MFFVRAETILIICLNVSVCLFVILLRLIDDDVTPKTIMLYQSVGVLSLVAFHTFSWIRQGGSDLSLAYLFFLMVFIFNMGKSILFVFFPSLDGVFFTFFTEHDYLLVVRAIEYGYIGMLFLSIAMLLTQYQSPPKQIKPTDVQLLAAQVIGAFFLIVSVPAALYDLQSMLIKVLTGGYFAIYASEQSYGAAGIVKVLSFFLFPAFYISIIAFKHIKALIYFIFVFAAIYTLVRLAMGARLVALVPFLILLSLWDVSIKHVSRKIIYAGGLFMVAVVFPTLSVIRTGGDVESGHGDGGAVFSIIKEMSDSISPLVWVMERVPIEADFTYGYSFYLAMTTAVPNFFWDVHPAKEGSLALWLVNEVNPWIAEAGGGYGFSIFAEMYLNFYWLGILALLFFGVFFTRLAMVKSNPINTAFCFACFLGIMLWPRGEAVAVGRFILWHVGMPWIGYHLIIFALGRYR